VEHYPIKAHIIHDWSAYERAVILAGEMAKLGIAYSLWPAWVSKPVHVGISKAHKQIVYWAKTNGLEEVLIGEDDVHFPAGRKGFEYFLENKPKDYDIYLAGVYVGREGLKEDRQLKRFAGMHFYFVHSRFYDKFLALDETQSIDNALGVLAIMGQAKIYSLYPMAAIQHENVSATSGCVFYHKFFFNENNVYGFGNGTTKG
jgi:hypothetical protein